MKKALIGITLICIVALTGSNDSLLLQRPAPQQRQESVPLAPESAKYKAAKVQTEKKDVLTNGIVPARLYIPSIDLHAAVETVHALDNGQMGVPKSTKTVGYLANGVLPGAPGNAIMDGHVDSYTGPAIFYRLKRLNKGDVVIVKNGQGKAIEFIVQAVEAYKTSEAPIDRIFGPAKDSRLNLITCTGKYSRKKREHLERLVVYTTRHG